MSCEHQTQGTRADLQRNALRLEVIPSGNPRCLRKRPSHWPSTSSGVRWIASGGAPEVFGRCDRDCPPVA